MVAKPQILIVTGGAAVSENLLRQQIEKSDYIIAADGGVKLLIEHRVTPDLIVGDFDSAPKGLWHSVYSDIPVVTFPKEKDYTDTELAILEALKRPCETICILGGTGTRLDHTLANMMLLQRIEASGIHGIILDDHNCITVLIEGQYDVSKEEWSFFSLVPLTDILVVSLEGFKFPLDHAKIAQASTVTISNEFLASTGVVNIHEGRALLILSRD